MRSLITILFFSALHLSAQSGEILKDLGDGWYEVMGTSSLENQTLEQARRKAEDIACREAIEHFSGVQVSSSSSYVLGESEHMDVDKYSQIINSVSAGSILEKMPISQKLVDGSFDIEVKIKVKVGQQKGKADPKFKLKSSLDREYYKHGEEMTISVTPSMDCYLNILNFSSNDSVYILFPNTLLKNNFIRSGETFLLPSEENRERGIRFRVGLLPGKDEDLEMIKILATKENIPFTALSSISTIGTYESTATDIIGWIMDIPRDKMTESTLQYWIYK
ncbi:MAG: DUF4384 domain-containing protein [Candidatus Marinimicrobia bacterium]|jgi:hypothetical protein|nr:DUF4384 domain-containing protein [Candidatus Neomarinimicrobiota bacterium]MBT6937239.1 DUF4384 domain-containing protein [Candidatus Neomarinimicrobiota bacterium]MBT7269924.1 DUF4384 domain-containing protein [Candidatus Neomarinimicrobiota bacterium]